MRGGRPGPTALAILLLLAGITGGLLWEDPRPAPLLRHAYLIPTLWGALRFGRWGGALVSLVAVLLYVPLVLPALEEGELTRETLEGLLFLGWLGGIGPLAGALVSQARARAERYEALLALQRLLACDVPLDGLLGKVAEQVRESLRADAVTLVVATEGGGPVAIRCEDGGTKREIPSGCGDDSAAAWVWRRRRSLFIPDLESDARLGGDGLAMGRPRRAFLVPLQRQADPLGVVVVERIGELGEGERQAIETLGVQLALGIENACLAQRQRCFAEELVEKVAAATQRLRELDQAKSDFVSIVSHELRTPLTSIQGLSELLLNRRIPPERQRQFLTYILHESERLGRIVENLLDLSRIETGTGKPFNRVVLDLLPLLEVNAEVFGCQSPIHEVRVGVSGDLPSVLADRDAVDRVLKNLISNAIKYSPGGGLVFLRAVRSVTDPRLVEISVEDQGVGIPADSIGRIFEKYYRVPHADAVRGFGIGLALVKSLVEAHGGTAWVTSSPGQGSCFRVTLPIA